MTHWSLLFFYFQRKGKFSYVNQQFEEREANRWRRANAKADNSNIVQRRSFELNSDFIRVRNAEETRTFLACVDQRFREAEWNCWKKIEIQSADQWNILKIKWRYLKVVKYLEDIQDISSRINHTTEWKTKSKRRQKAKSKVLHCVEKITDPKDSTEWRMLN